MAPYIVGGDTDCSKRIRIQDTKKTHSEGEVFLLSHERGWAVLDVVISFTCLILLLMVQKSGVHQLIEVGSLSHLFPGSVPGWLFGISEPSTVGCLAGSSQLVRTMVYDQLAGLMTYLT